MIDKKKKPKIPINPKLVVFFFKFKKLLSNKPYPTIEKVITKEVIKNIKVILN